MMRKLFLGLLAAAAVVLSTYGAWAAGTQYAGCPNGLVTATAVSAAGSPGLVCIMDPGRGNVTIYLSLVAGTGTFSANLTGDQPGAAGYGTTNNWVAETNLSAKTASSYDVFTGQATAISLSVSVCSSCTIAMSIVQGAPGGGALAQ